jgi:(1->4)-alpha-D-glucan 1-alpha-D-glucosylmutase
LREAKLRSSWRSPNEAYENQYRSFARYLLTAGEADRFRSSVDSFVEHVAVAAAGNSIVQLVLRSTLPGVTDLYRGNEFWDLSLVDPDNRRPVDFGTRERMLETLSGSVKLSDWSAEGTKLAITARLLNAGKSNASLFREGTYRPLEAVGAKAEQVIAFARELGDARLVVIAARHFVELLDQAAAKPVLNWGNTEVLDHGASVRMYLDAWDGTQVCLPERVAAWQLLSDVPARVLLALPPQSQQMT